MAETLKEQVMASAKQDAEAMIRSLQDDATFEDMQYRLYVLDKIRRGMADIHENGGVSHKNAKERFKKWLTD